MTDAVLNTKHLELFGGIIVAYARVELGIKITLSGMLNEQISVASILSEPYSNVPLRNVATSIARIKLSSELAHDFCELVKVFGTYNGIRNAIAHDMWVAGTREVAIRPARVNINSGYAKPRGFEETEDDYTLNELEQVCNELLQLIDEIKKFQQKSVLRDKIEKLNSDLL